jgi:hypothetical protein
MRHLHKGLLFVSAVLFIIAIYIIVKMIVAMAQGEYAFFSSNFWWALTLHIVISVIASQILVKAAQRR